MAKNDLFWFCWRTNAVCVCSCGTIELAKVRNIVPHAGSNSPPKEYPRVTLFLCFFFKTQTLWMVLFFFF